MGIITFHVTKIPRRIISFSFGTFKYYSTRCHRKTHRNINNSVFRGSVKWYEVNKARCQALNKERRMNFGTPNCFSFAEHKPSHAMNKAGS